MLKRRIEVKRTGRNLLCPNYKDCLDHAILSRSTGFSCGDCGRRFDATPIPPDEPLRAAALLGEILFRTERKIIIKATCPRCGKNHRIGSCIGGSLKRFCQNCLTHIGSTWLGETELAYEMRSAKIPAPPAWADEHGITE